MLVYAYIVLFRYYCITAYWGWSGGGGYVKQRKI